MGDYPFATTVELETLQSSLIKQNSGSLSHQSQRFQNSKIGVFGRYLELENSKKGIPNFFNIQFGASYRHYLEDNKSVGIFASVGSSSNKPFKDGRDGTVLINATYQLNDKWLLLGNYSNNRTFMNNIPLPGFAYIKEQSREKTTIIGFPFIYILNPFFEGAFSFRYVGILPYNHKMRILYNNFSVIKPYIGFEQGPMVFFNTDRTTDNLRTFWFERRVALGLEKSFGPFLKIDLQTGNSFDREYFNSRSFLRKHTNINKIHDGMYVSLNLKSSF